MVGGSKRFKTHRCKEWLALPFTCCGCVGFGDCRLRLLALVDAALEVRPTGGVVWTGSDGVRKSDLN